MGGRVDAETVMESVVDNGGEGGGVGDCEEGEGGSGRELGTGARRWVGGERVRGWKREVG